MAADNAAFLAGVQALRERLSAAQPALAERLVAGAGIEVRSAGSLRTADDWRLPDFGSAPAPAGAAPLALTLRAAGDLNVNHSLSAGFSGLAANSAALVSPAATLRLVGGADLGAAHPSSVVAIPVGGVGGQVSIGRAGATPSAAPPAVLVRSTTGSIDISAAGDVRLVNNAVRVYTSGSPMDSGTLPGWARLGLAPDQALREGGRNIGPLFEGAGDITLRAGRDLLGSPSRQYVTDWWWRQAGVRNAGQPAAWWSRYDQFQQGVASFGGGDIEVRAGRDVVDLEVSTPSSGYAVRADAALPAVSLVQPGGSLRWEAGRDIVSGLAFGGGPLATLRAGRSIVAAPETGLGRSLPGLQLFYGDTSLSVDAVDAVRIGNLANPALLAGVVQSTGQARLDVITGLDTRARVDVQSVAGDVRWSGDVVPISPSTDPRNTNRLLPQAPHQLQFSAPQGSITVTAPLVQRPVGDSRLQLLAAQDLSVANVVAGAASPAAEPLPLARLPAEQQLRQLWRTTTARDPELDAGGRAPVQLVAREGDLRFTADLASAQPLRAIAGRDLAGSGSAALTLQHQRPDELSLMRAGRDWVLADNTAARVRLAGPGELLVLAGRDADLRSAAGIVTVGNQDNPRLLPEGGARITIVSGVDWARGADYATALAGGFQLGAGGAGIARFGGELWAWVQALDAGRAPPAAGSAELAAAAAAWQALGLDAQVQRVRVRVGDAAWQQALREAMRRALGDPSLGAAEAESAFAGLDAGRRAETERMLVAATLAATQPRDAARAWTGALLAALGPEQTALQLHEVLFAELRAAGRAAARLPGGAERDAAYAPGYAALAALYPAAAGGGAEREGDIRLASSQVKTQQGGDIRLLAPRGGIDAGSLVGSGGKPASELGVLTTSGGRIEAAVRDDFAVNQSRVFTLARGDLLIWASEGSIDAGRGAKTVTGAPPPVFTIDRDGNVVVDASGSFSGSGIAVLDAASDLDLYAPKGEISAGEAGIASRGTIFLGAQQVRGADNIQTAAPPPPPPAQGASAGLASLGNSANTAAAQARGSDSDEEDERKRRRARRSLLLEFLGFGGSN